MEIKKVKIINKDESTGIRTIKVKTSQSSFTTPSRTLTSTEHNYRTGAILPDVGLGSGISISFENPTFEITKQHTIEQMEKFTKKNGALHNAQRDVKAKLNCYEDKFRIYYPRFNKGTKIDFKHLRTLIDFQTIFCEMDTVSILEQHPDQNVDSFSKDLNFLSQQAYAQEAKTVIPYIDFAMDNNLFIRKYRLLKDMGFKVIGFTNRSLKTYYPNYRFIREQNDDIWLHCSGINRYWQSNWTTSQIHMLQLFGLDTFSLESKCAICPKPKPIEEIKRFDSNTMGIISIEDFRKRYHNDLNCNCPVCVNKKLNDYISEYSIDRTGVENTNLLDKYCKLHETYCSEKEFTKSQRFIKNNEGKHYIESKEYLNKVVPSIIPENKTAKFL